MARMTIQQLCRENQIYKLKVIQLTKELQMLECDYNARLKDDMAAMLAEIQTEIEDLYPEHQCSGELTGFAEAIETITPIIQQKINELKGDQEGEE